MEHEVSLLKAEDEVESYWKYKRIGVDEGWI